MGERHRVTWRELLCYDMRTMALSIALFWIIMRLSKFSIVGDENYKINDADDLFL